MTDIEVFGVINDFNGEKAPGPDGFFMAFFQSCWCVLKTEIMAIFHNFHTQAVFEKSLNASFLALIPKKVDAVEVKDFRPISLVGFIRLFLMCWRIGSIGWHMDLFRIHKMPL